MATGTNRRRLKADKKLSFVQGELLRIADHKIELYSLRDAYVAAYAEIRADAANGINVIRDQHFCRWQFFCSVGCTGMTKTAWTAAFRSFSDSYTKDSFDNPLVHDRGRLPAYVLEEMRNRRAYVSD